MASVGRKRIITKKKVVKASYKAFGNQEAMCKLIGVTRTPLFLFLKKHPELRKVMDEDRERLIDFAENKMASLIDAKDAGMIKWFLSCRAKDRGYSRDSVHTVLVEPGKGFYDLLSLAHKESFLVDVVDVVGEVVKEEEEEEDVKDP